MVTVASLNWKVGLRNGDQGCCFSQQPWQLHLASLQVWAVDVTASLSLLKSWQETVTQSGSPVPTL